MNHRTRTSLAIGSLLAVLLLVPVTAPDAATEEYGHQALPGPQLAKEHEVTARVADVAGRVAAGLRDDSPVARQQVADLHDFFVNFVDACHHTKEEEFFFPAMLVADPARSDVVTTLELHHDIGKALLSGVGRALAIWDRQPQQARREAADNLEAYALMIRRHIELESSALVETADRTLSAEQQSFVRAGFHYVEAEQLGEGFHEKYHALAEKILADQRD